MKKLSRGTCAAIAAVIAIPAGVAIAKSVEHRRWHSMSPETRMRLNEGRIAMAKAALKLTPDQEKLWTPLEAQARDAMKSMADKHADRQKMREARDKDRADAKQPDMAERLDRMSQNMGERADRMKSFAAAFRPFYATLSDEQKDVLRPLMRDLAPGFGNRGHHGGRHAWFGGWGPGGRHHGKHHGDHHRGEGWGGGTDQKGPARESGGPGPDGGRDGGRPDAKPQYAPDYGDDMPVPGDSL